ncbi:MAG: ATP-dependent Clp protease adaptor ClpS [Bacteroidia bacterium]|nr:ATP-dependent Clp protease adaptor ClpS [Bacteroidia bacterium]
MMLFSTLTEEETLVADELVSTADVSFLVLHNDDINTFDHVIACLIQICEHELLQAEQCAMIVHTKGKAIVKTAEKELLVPMKRALLDEGLTATIESERK